MLKFKPDATFIQKIGGYGWTETSFDHPTGIASPNGLDVYVSDYGNHRIQRFDRNLNYVSTLYLRDAEERNKRFGYPAGVDVDRFGALYVIDGENIRIIKLKRNVVERTFGGIDAGEGRLHNPTKIKVSTDDFVYVMDEQSMVVFDVFGNFIKKYDAKMCKDVRTISLLNEMLAFVDNNLIQTLKDGEIDTIAVIPSDKKGKPVIIRDFRLWKDSIYYLSEHHIYRIPYDMEKKEE